MKEMFKKTPQTMSQPLTLKQKFQKLMTDIGGRWYKKKISKILTPIRRPKLNKNHKSSRLK